MTLLQRLVMLGIAVTIPMSMMETAGPAVSTALPMVALALGWWLVPRFWRTVGHAVMAGVLAGVVILGPGLRLAMRIVAIADPLKVPEFTVGGTFFIILGIGGIFGAGIAVSGSLLARATGVGSRLWRAVILTVLFMAVLLMNTDLRVEFRALGAGPWANIPLFATVTFGYALSVFYLMDRLGRRGSDPVVIDAVEVPA